MIKSLYPLAKITALCQSPRANDKSILRLALKYVNDERMTPEAKAEQARFLQYMCTSPTGVEIPLLGMITEQSLVRWAKVVATVSPLLMTYFLKALGRRD